MKLHLSDLKIGDRLSAEVFNNHGIPVLSAGKELTKEDIDKLELHSIEYVDISVRSHDIEATSNKKSAVISQNIQPHFIAAVTGIKNLFDEVREEGKFNDQQINHDLQPLVDNFKSERDVVSLLLELNSKDDYTYKHSVQVGMISYFIAKWLGKSDKDAYIVGKCGYLHDIGKSQIDSEILQKPEKLTDSEYNLIKKHTIHGYDIINKSIGDKVFALAALQHHERFDGTGYPHGLKGDKIHPVAKIISVADIYSAMISSRAYQKKRDLLFVLKELNRLSFKEIDPLITQTFIKNMIPNFIGKKVALKSGESGIIIYNNPNNFFHPLIKVDETYIDLSRNQSVHEIEMIYI